MSGTETVNLMFLKAIADACELSWIEPLISLAGNRYLSPENRCHWTWRRPNPYFGPYLSSFARIALSPSTTLYRSDYSWEYRPLSNLDPVRTLA